MSAADPEVKLNSSLSRMEHKIDLVLRLLGLTCEQIEQIVEAKDAATAQQALISEFTKKAPDKPPVA